MGGGASTEIGGVRVFKVHPGSPAAETGLEVFFDFIVEVNGTKLDPNCQSIFAEKIQESKNCPAKLTVFNTRAHSTREVTVTPREWAGNGLLGATVRYDVVDPAENQGIRVLEVFPNSPAAHAGLVPFQDFLLATAQAVFHDIDELVEVVTCNINQRMQVYVYNADSETVREVFIVPNNDWGGDGCIGCDIGTGMFHKIPAPRRPPGANAVAAAAPTGTWATALVQGLPPPAYPPAAVPAGAVPKVPSMPGTMLGGMPGTMPGTTGIPGGMPGIPTAPAMPGSITGATGNIPPVPGSITGATGHIPPVPGSITSAWGNIPPVPGTGGTSLPGIAVSGTWNPAAAAAAGGRLAVQWPPVGKPLDEDEQPSAASPAPMLPAMSPMPGGAFMSPSMLPHGMHSAELPRAPPGTPMNVNDTPPPVDLSSVFDPARYANVAASPGASPVNSAQSEAAALL